MQRPTQFIVLALLIAFGGFLPLMVHAAAQPVSVLMPEDTCDDSDGKPCPPVDPAISLAVTGLDAEGDVPHKGFKALAFELHGAKIDPSLTKIELATAGNGSKEILPWFDFDAAAQSLTLQKGHMAEFVTTVQQTSEAGMAITLCTGQPDTCYLFMQPLHRK